MSIRSRQQYICQWIRQSVYRSPEVCRDGQQGFVSLAALCLMMLMLGFGLAILYFVRAAWSDNIAYQQEMDLRLAAEGAVEQEARMYELGRGISNEYRAMESSAAMPEMEVRVTPEYREDKLILTGAACWRPAGGWLHKKVVRGLLRKRATKKGERYVWCGWAR
ncbi:MAG: hypothetical protein KBI24_02695 [Selenomonas sp.]|nr:hypothetical protein [Selenomonas sp.]